MKSGLIQRSAEMETKNKRQSPGQMMSAIVNGAAMRKQFEDVLRDKAPAFVASLIDLYASDTYLQECDPAKVALEALKAATLDLPINKSLGFAWIVPYRKNGIQTPQFQIGYKGLIQLAIRTGVYKHINAGVVYEGMTVETDVLSGDVKIIGEAASDKAIGYFAYLETLNGFSHALYWSRDKVTAHAKKFSKSFNRASSAWQTDFNAMAQVNMLRNLISHWGIMSVQMQDAVLTDDADQYADDAAIENAPQNTIEADYTVDTDTGDVFDGAAQDGMQHGDMEQTTLADTR